MDVADGEPQRGRSHARTAAGDGLHKPADAAQHQKREGGRADEDGGDEAIAREDNGEGGEKRRNGAGGQDVGQARQALAFEAQLPEQRRGGNVTGAAEGQKGEGQRHHEAEERCGAECGRIYAPLRRNRQDRRERRTGREGHERAEYEADADAHRGDHEDLHQIDGEDEAARGAEALEGGDDAALAVEIGAHGIGDTDAADHQRGQADQRQELREALDVCGERRRGVGARAYAPAGLRESGGRLFPDSGDGSLAGAGRQLHLVAELDQAARLDEAGGAQAVHRYQQAGREAEAVGGGIRLGDDARPQFEGGAADADAVSQRHAEPVEQQLRRRRAEDAVRFGEQFRRGQRRVDLQRAIERIGLVDRLGFDERLVGAVLQPRHGAHGGADGDRSQTVEEGALFRFCLALVELEADVAAEQRLPLAGYAGSD